MAKEKLNENTDAVNERENGRAIILCVLKILEKYSDADHPLTRDAIADKLVEDFIAENGHMYIDLADIS